MRGKIRADEVSRVKKQTQVGERWREDSQDWQWSMRVRDLDVEARS